MRKNVLHPSLSRMLKNYGFDQHSLYYWVKTEDGSYLTQHPFYKEIIKGQLVPEISIPENYSAAFTTDELIERLVAHPVFSEELKIRIRFEDYDMELPVSSLSHTRMPTYIGDLVHSCMCDIESKAKEEIRRKKEEERKQREEKQKTQESREEKLSRLFTQLLAELLK